jgi:hypothetical protein
MLIHGGEVDKNGDGSMYETLKANSNAFSTLVVSGI